MGLAGLLPAMLEALESIPITAKINKEAEIRWFLKSLPTLKFQIKNQKNQLGRGEVEAGRPQ